MEQMCCIKQLYWRIVKGIELRSDKAMAIKEYVDAIPTKLFSFGRPLPDFCNAKSLTKKERAILLSELLALLDEEI